MRRIKRTEVAPLTARILRQQLGRCAICGVPLVQGKKARLNGSYRGLPCLDHDHDNGAVRGVLCNTCNTGEGKVKSDAVRYGMGKEEYLDWLIKLVAYLHKRRVPVHPYIHPEHKTEDEKRLERNRKARLARQKKVKK